MADIFATLEQIGVVPVITIERADAALPLARALHAGGIPCAEITFRTAAATAAIARIAGALPDMLVGAGTVLTVAQAEQAVAAGARFLVSPGFAPALAAWCRTRSIPLLPGVATPTEVMQALDYDLRVLKFFPAEEAGGVAMLRALAGPFAQVRFVPTGGISPANLRDYLALPNVIACGGSWMAGSRLINTGQWAEITSLAAQARELVDAAL
ncbi:MAG: bifunctional 4-hydroxy-2-oxoglutarate aldolase/2-dehydro-3-deoxy-phosphogluconate aldolase [Oscillochloris sp.]|nr:bifunctional 4-hydroxy-2-oxoglutarate aldolase/2-dehydro-3-deoxy-phosphogluconate aldolase [Oscillochloris sp.]